MLGTHIFRTTWGWGLVALTVAICAVGLWIARRSLPVVGPLYAPAVASYGSIEKPSPLVPRNSDQRRRTLRVASASALVSLEPLPPGRIHGFFTGFRRSRFAPPKLLSRSIASVPGPLAAHLHHDTPVTLKFHVDQMGQVSNLEIVEAPEDAELTQFAASTAGQWRFEPARVNERIAGSEVLARFRFRPGNGQ